MRKELYPEQAIAARLAALDYAANGLRLFPCDAESKRPLVAWSTAASDDPAIVARYWAKWPDAAIGWPTGDGTVVVDVDTRSGGRLDPSWPDTLTATTPSGGWHLFYSVPAGVRIPNSVNHVALGVDIRGDRGMVVLPGTPGREWVDLSVPVAPLPASLLAAIRRPKAGSSSGFEPVETRCIGEGARNDYLARFAGYAIAAGIDDEAELIELALAHNDEVCDPPMDADEVTRTCRSVLQTAERNGSGSC